MRHVCQLLGILASCLLQACLPCAHEDRSRRAPVGTAPCGMPMGMPCGMPIGMPWGMPIGMPCGAVGRADCEGKADIVCNGKALSVLSARSYKPERPRKHLPRSPLPRSGFPSASANCSHLPLCALERERERERSDDEEDDACAGAGLLCSGQGSALREATAVRRRGASFLGLGLALAAP